VPAEISQPYSLVYTSCVETKTLTNFPTARKTSAFAFCIYSWSCKRATRLFGGRSKRSAETKWVTNPL